MAAPAAIINYGSRFTCEQNNVRRSIFGLDSGTQRWVTDDAADLLPGTRAPSPYDALIILENHQEQEGDDIIHNLSLAGLVSGTSKHEQGYPKTTETISELDDAQDSLVATSDDLVAVGDALGGHSDMICVSIGREPLLKIGSSVTHFRLTPVYRGLMATGKPYKRSITVNAQSVSPQNPTAVDLPGGWPSTPRKSVIDFPKIVVRDIVVSTSAPPTVTRREPWLSCSEPWVTVSPAAGAICARRNSARTRATSSFGLNGLAR